MVKKYNYINVEMRLYEMNGKPLIIWGRGENAIRLFLRLKFAQVNIIGFTDSFVKDSGESFCGVKVYTFDELREAGDINIYISIQHYIWRQEILEKLEGLSNATVYMNGTVWGCGIYDQERLKEITSRDKAEIDFVRSNLEDEKSVRTFDNLLDYRVNGQANLIKEVQENMHEQYFPGTEIFTLQPGEVFIDAGAYSGETSEAFSKWCGDYSKIYLMEPDTLMFQVASEYIKLKNIKNVIFVNKGAYSYATEIAFVNDAALGSSNINKSGTDEIRTISIDDMLNGEKVTYIKMDIEGAEMEALCGAEKTIRKYMPKLAISVYHKDDDIWKIPCYIKRKYPQYKLFIRHYTPFTTETILYATT